MKAMLTAALLAALTIPGSAFAADPTPPANAPRAEAPTTFPPNALPAVPKDGGKDGPFNNLFRAGINARVHRIHGFRAEVVGEQGTWYVVYYPFP